MALAASRIRFSSSSMVLRYSSTTSTGRSRALWGTKRATRRASACISRRSASMTGSMSGRITLMTISRPFSFKRAVWTWAMEADASGVSSKSSNRVSMGQPRLASIWRLASCPQKGGTLSCSRASSSAMSGGSRSRRVDSIWPNLMKMGPRASKARRMRAPRHSSGCLFLSQNRLRRTRRPGQG
ncbi:hypothetical protein D3C78_1130790 [compost metagenome]